MPAPIDPEYRAALVEQIRRDVETLRGEHIDEDPTGRAFYEQRIAAYRAVLTAPLPDMRGWWWSMGRGRGSQ